LAAALSLEACSSPSSSSAGGYSTPTDLVAAESARSNRLRQIRKTPGHALSPTPTISPLLGRIWLKQAFLKLAVARKARKPARLSPPLAGQRTHPNRDRHRLLTALTRGEVRILFHPGPITSASVFTAAGSAELTAVPPAEREPSRALSLRELAAGSRVVSIGRAGACPSRGIGRLRLAPGRARA